MKLTEIRSILAEDLPRWSWTLHTPGGRHPRPRLTGKPRHADYDDLLVEIDARGWTLYRLAPLERKTLSAGHVISLPPEVIAARVVQVIRGAEVTA